MDERKYSSCFFTGHRIISAKEAERLEKALDAAILELIDCGVTRFLAGGALGFDLLAEKAVLRAKEKHKILLCLVLPCEKQDKNWRESQRAEFKYICDNADEIIYATKKYIPGCMHLRNRYLAENADVCVCYYNEGRSGGTAFTVGIAKERGTEIINLA